MSKSIKLQNNTYLDSSSIVHNKKSLKELLNDGIVYSTEEQVIGTWLDGKPIYRNVIETTKSQVSNIMTFLNIKRLLSTVGSYATSIYNNSWPIPCYYTEESGYRITIMGGDTPGENVGISFNSFYNDSSKVILVLEYTKTTD